MTDISPLTLVDSLADWFETAWKRRQRPLIEDFVHDLPDHAGELLLQELLAIELHYRRHWGEVPSCQEYCRRFPQFVGPVKAAFADDSAHLTETRSRDVGEESGCGNWQDADSFGSREISLDRSPVRLQDVSRPRPGETTADFEIVRVLGKGAFGQVFLARQISLDRPVALKVTANIGREGRTMAGLQHDCIVQLFSESIDAQNNLRLLCMEYVPGATLDRVIQELRRRPSETWSGRKIVEIIELLSDRPAACDPAKLRERELLRGCDFPEAVCWIGQRLVEGLAHAHSQGVLHRDIKPANILLNQYGRPMLTDFSLSSQVATASQAAFGGTPAYMAPEHLDACQAESPKGREAVNERSDLYALGLVLFELLTGERALAPGVTDRGDGIYRRLAAQRRSADLITPLKRRGVPEALVRILSRCLDPEPSRRYQTASECTEALAGCRELLAVQRRMPAGGLSTQLVRRHPFLFMAGLTVLPNWMALAFLVVYQLRFVTADLSQAQRAALFQLQLVSSAITIPVCLLLLYKVLSPWLHTWPRVQSLSAIATAEMRDIRRRSFVLPVLAIVLSCIGWLPYAVIAPVGLVWLAGPAPEGILWHLAVSRLLVGLVALVHNYFVAEFAVVRGLYMRLWADANQLEEPAASELAWVAPRNHFFQILAGLIPLTGATLLALVGPEQPDAEGLQEFQRLLVVLIGAGVVGFWLAMTVSEALAETVRMLTGARRAASH